VLKRPIFFQIWEKGFRRSQQGGGFQLGYWGRGQLRQQLTEVREDPPHLSVLYKIWSLCVDSLPSRTQNASFHAHLVLWQRSDCESTKLPNCLVYCSMGLTFQSPLRFWDGELFFLFLEGKDDPKSPLYEGNFWNLQI